MEDQRPTGLIISPMGIGEVLDTGFTLARRNYRWLVTITAWGAVPSYVFFALGQASATTIPPVVVEEGTLPLANVGGFAVGFLTFAIGATLTSAALVLAVARLIYPTGDVEERLAGSLYGLALRRFLRMVALGIIFVLASIPLMILFPLGIYIWVRWSLAWVAVVIEGHGPFSALRRSWALTRGSWWHTVVVVATSSLIVGILSSVVGGVFGVIGALLSFLTQNDVLEAVTSALGQGVGFILVEGFSAAIVAVLYYELRARTEGFDLEQRGVQLAPRL